MQRKIVSTFSILLTIWAAPARAQDQNLRIVTLEGEGAFNDIKRKMARNPLIEVRDQNGQPVQGAQVVFTLPEIGASGYFPGGAKKFAASTDAQGRATTTDLKPNSIEGRYNIMVTAVAPGGSGAAVISQSNTLAGGLVGVKDGSNAKKWVILMLLSGGAAGGIYAATRNGSAGAAAAPVPTTLSPGPITVGGLR